MPAVLVMPVRSGGGRRPKTDGRERYRLFPQHPPRGRAALYAVGYADGRTKIGMTGSPRQRAMKHFVVARGAVTWVHLFAFVPERRCGMIERAAHRYAEQLSERDGGFEIFRGLSREDALACVRRAIREGV